ncbi:MAG: hypothetical protein JWL81_1960, partial [Verrucomicrobiales bacterium]|nr:hypothetical protein [Verrucomicrobiales bacterium]
LSILCSAALSGPAAAIAQQPAAPEPLAPAAPAESTSAAPNAAPSAAPSAPSAPSAESLEPSAPTPSTAPESSTPEPTTPESTGPPPRPASRVLDQTGALTAGERAALSRDFTSSAESGLSVYYIALDSTEGLADQDAAGELARLWEDAPFTAVFLNVPGKPLTIGFSGSAAKALSREEIKILTESALSAGHLRQSMPEQGKAAARRLIEDYTRFRAGEPLTPFSGAHATGGSGWSPNELLFWGGCFSVLALLLLMFILRRSRIRRPKLFPLTAPRSRFSAPHSGGNNAMISFPNDRAD